MISISRQFGRTIFIWSAVGIALGCSACATVSPTARSRSTEGGAVQAIYQEDSKAAAGAKASQIQQLGSSPPDAGVTRVRRDSAIQQMSYVDETGQPNAIQQAGWVSNGSNPGMNCPPGLNPGCPPNLCPVDSCPPEVRWPAAGPNPMAPGMMACDVCNTPSPEKFTDEYLCDGGDRDLPVHYDAYNRLSLDTEDTVVEYTDRTGFEHVKPSNRVCVYAPRFSSVRTVTRPHEGLGTNEVGGVGNMVGTGGVHTRLKASNSVKREMTGGIAVRSRAGGLDTEQGQSTVAQLRGPTIHEKLLNIYQSLSFVQTGRLNDADTARLNLGIQAASFWTREQNPVITAKTDMVLEGRFTQTSAAITGIDDEVKEAEQLRIVKLADKKTAQPGDEIQFTIRYDNLGGKEAFHIRIVDNLTPRLEYIEDSATSDRAGRLVLQDNGEGSNILVWELDEPLPGKTGGTVTFKARVR